MTKGECFAYQNVRPATAVSPSGDEHPGVEIGWCGQMRAGEVVHRFVLPIPDSLDPAVAIAGIRTAVAEAYDRSLIY